MNLKKQHLFGIWLSKNISEGVNAFLSDSNQIPNLNKALINEIIERIEVNQWNEAKSLWILEYETKTKKASFLHFSIRIPHSGALYLNSSYVSQK